MALACSLAAAGALWLALRAGDAPGPPPTQGALATPAPAHAGAGEAPVGPPAQPPEPLAPAPAPVPTPSLPPPAAPAAHAPSALPASAAVSAQPALPLPPLPGPATRSTFALSSDHQTLIQGTSLAASDHDMLEREARDDAWATETERLIRQELARQGGGVDFDVIAVDCRQTICVIQAFSNGENGQRRWVAAVDELYKESLANVFDSVNTAFPTQGSSRSPVLTFLHRKPVARGR